MSLLCKNLSLPKTMWHPYNNLQCCSQTSQPVYLSHRAPLAIPGRQHPNHHLVLQESPRPPFPCSSLHRIFQTSTQMLLSWKGFPAYSLKFQAHHFTTIIYPPFASFSAFITTQYYLHFAHVSPLNVCSLPMHATSWEYNFWFFIILIETVFGWIFNTFVRCIWKVYFSTWNQI